MEFDRKPIDLQDPGKPFTDGGMPIGFTALDYWRFQFSNFWDMYEEVAEFLVNKALGMPLPFNKNGSTLFDIKYKGKRLEVKATAYHHSWRKDGEYSESRVFSIAETQGQHSERDAVPTRHNDVYVFCLSTGKTHQDADPFEMSHWEFYVVPTSIINEKCGHNKTIALGKVREITPDYGKVSYGQLKKAIDKALGLGQ